MSATSILDLTRERYAEETEDNLLQMAESYFYHKYFMVGVKPERDRINHAMLFHRILCPQNCQMVNLIERKIHGELEKCGKKPLRKKISHLIEQHEKEFKNNPINDQWAEIDW